MIVLAPLLPDPPADHPIRANPSRATNPHRLPCAVGVHQVQAKFLAAHDHHLRPRRGVPDDRGDLAHERRVGVPVRQLLGLQVVLEHVCVRAVLEGQRIEHAVLEQRLGVRVQEPLQRGRARLVRADVEEDPHGA